jgi:hypothetical protein
MLSEIDTVLANKEPGQNNILFIVAGWSSPVARRAHNPKVTGSNPVPAIWSGSSVG